MAYSTTTDLEERVGAAELIALADLDEDGAADTAAIADAIADADAHINSYLAVLFVVPIVPVPDVLVKRSTTLAIYFLQLRQNSVTEDMRKEYENITQWLKDVLAGKATLDAATKPPEAPGAGGIHYETKPRVFGRDEPL